MTEFFTVVPPDVARDTFFQHFGPLGQTERVSTQDALDRITSSEALSPQALPAFPRSTMDGYAVRAADTYGASDSLPAYLDVTGEVAMGEGAGIEVGAAQAVVVHTGGMIPPGADAVVIVEHTQPVGEGNEIEVHKSVAVGENVLNVGEDIQPEQPILPAGHRIRPQDVGGLLALGITEVEVARQPRVAIFATGDEVVPPEIKTGPGQIRDINSYTRTGQTARAGGIPILGCILPDDFEMLTARTREALAEADVLVISAGSSVSVRDMTSRVFDSLGEPGVLVHGVAVKPGHPTILGVAGGKPLVGLPGNPVSAMIVYDLFGVPTLYRLQNATSLPRRGVVWAKLAKNIASESGREDYVAARLVERDGELWAEPVFGKSNLIFTLVNADGVLKVPLNANGLEAGVMIEVRLF
jgi:molybdopterin molybdotransferase